MLYREEEKSSDHFCIHYLHVLFDYYVPGSIQGTNKTHTSRHRAWLPYENLMQERQKFKCHIQL